MGQIAKPFRSAFNAAKILSSSDVALLANKWQEIGEYEVPVGTAIALGYGSLISQEGAVGRLYMDLKDDTATPANYDGLVRLELWDPQDRAVGTLFEARTEQLRRSTTPSEQLTFPMQPENQKVAVATPYWKIKVMFLPDRADTLDVSACTVLMDVTQFYHRP